MKRLILSFATLMLVMSTVTAQDVRFGPKAGVNISNVKFKFDGDSESYDSKVGFHVGGFAEIGLAESFAIQPELLFSTLGTQQKEDGDKWSFNLSYLSVPVLFKYKVAGFGAYLGPQVGFLLGAKEKYKIDGDTESDDVKEEYKGIDFAGVIGVEYNLNNGLGFSARYQAGLSNIYDFEGDDDGNSVKVSAIQIGVHYTIGKK